MRPTLSFTVKKLIQYYYILFDFFGFPQVHLGRGFMPNNLTMSSTRLPPLIEQILLNTKVLMIQWQTDLAAGGSV